MRTFLLFLPNVFAVVFVILKSYTAAAKPCRAKVLLCFAPILSFCQIQSAKEFK
jgi:hypothetical protein